MTGCPSCAETWSITTRDMTSVALPGVRGTISRIGFAGQPGAEACAQAGVQVPGKPANAMAAASHQRNVLGLVMWGSRIWGSAVRWHGRGMALEASPAARYITAMPGRHATSCRSGTLFPGPIFVVCRVFWP